ncbi:MAG: VWA domain-containing protein [Pyrinomonadaceae bacterium]
MLRQFYSVLNFCLVGCALLLALPFNAKGQQLPIPPGDQSERPRRVNPPADALVKASDDEDIIRVDTDLVLVDVSVNDRSGRPVRGLKPSDFKLYEDDLERPVTFFDIEKRTDLQRPLAIVFALDVSGSMTPEELLRLREAVRAFVSKLSERQTLFAIISFGMDVKVRQSLTRDKQKLERALMKCCVIRTAFRRMLMTPLTTPSGCSPVKLRECSTDALSNAL